jgi:DNA replication and repair protein RecF
MRARNKLLAEPDGADPQWLSALEAGMAEHGAAVAAARERLAGLDAACVEGDFFAALPAGAETLLPL